MADELTLTARWVFPVSSPPLERGTITVRDGKIAAVDASGTRLADVDLGNCALIPGLVNAHTHLDLSGLRGRVPPTPDLTNWLRAIVARRRQQAPEQVDADIRAGLAEALRHGTTLIGDISAAGDSWSHLSAAACGSVVFRELIGLPHQRVAAAWQEASRWLNERPDGERCRSGLSPHAPYSVNQALFRAAGNAGSPLAIHLAESADEAQLLDEHRGPLVDFLREVGAWDEDGLAPSHEWIVWRSERAPAILFAHANYLGATVRLPAHATVVYCPRTHAAFGHPPHPFREFLARGVRVALGTDSLASSPDLDVLAEARFVHERHPDFPLDDLLRLATLAGAESLGFDGCAGSLAPGKWADVVAVPLPDADADDPHELLFRPGAAVAAPRRTLWRGQWR
jgi:aminodeoxyfutalosine deaminase